MNPELYVTVALGLLLFGTIFGGWFSDTFDEPEVFWTLLAFFVIAWFVAIPLALFVGVVYGLYHLAKTLRKRWDQR